jgi:hypothetical protein
MIRCRSEIENKKIQIDLNGPQGNALFLIGCVDVIGKQINIPSRIRKDIKNTMMLGNYNQLLKTFDQWFGDYVILYK